MRAWRLSFNPASKCWFFITHHSIGEIKISGYFSMEFYVHSCSWGKQCRQVEVFEMDPSEQLHSSQYTALSSLEVLEEPMELAWVKNSTLCYKLEIAIGAVFGSWLGRNPPSHSQDTSPKQPHNHGVTALISLQLQTALRDYFWLWLCSWAHNQIRIIITGSWNGLGRKGP